MSRFEEVSPEEIKRIVDNATSINTKRSTKYGLKILLVSVCNKIFINNFRNFRNCQCKQGVTNIIITVFQSGWIVLEEKKFSKSTEEMSKQELNDCLKSFYTSARKQDGSYYKTSSMKSIRAALDRFLRSPPHLNGNFRLLDCLKIY